MDFLYRHVLKPLLFTQDPDVVHEVFVVIGEFAGRFWLTRKLFALIYDYRGPDISKTVDGITYRTPVLLAQLLPRLREIPCTKPVYLKMPINTPA